MSMLTYLTRICFYGRARKFLKLGHAVTKLGHVANRTTTHDDVQTQPTISFIERNASALSNIKWYVIACAFSVHWLVPATNGVDASVELLMEGKSYYLPKRKLPYARFTRASRQVPGCFHFYIFWAPSSGVWCPTWTHLWQIRWRSLSE